MNRIVYILGAGFSAPLGLPVVSNFLERSKDMYFQDREKFQHFSDVLNKIDEMSKAKNYYETDLLNIEEILSIIEMRESIFGDQGQERYFSKYIVDVIKHYTPRIKRANPENEWSSTIFGEGQSNLYGCFVASLLGYAFQLAEYRNDIYPKSYCTSVPAETDFEYNVITLNYDMVLEQITDYLLKKDMVSTSFKRSATEGVVGWENGLLAKLHGSADTGIIIPPTWNKGLANNSIRAEWQIAYNSLSNANHIRFIGYSLPTNDSYLKYLLLTSIMEADHLKTIDVLCLDPNESVSRRFHDFIKFKKLRFRSDTTENYLVKHMQEYGEGWPKEIQFDKLEHAHEDFFKNAN